MRKVWFNGQIVPESEAKLSIYDSALMYGDMVFEMMRTFNKHTFRLKEHLDRLFTSCKILEIPILLSHPCSREQPLTKSGVIYQAHEELLEKHIQEYPKEEEWRTLINVSRGILPMYQSMLNDKGKSLIIITCFPLRYVLKDKSKVYTEGVDVIVSFQRAISESFLDAKIKSRSRQHYKLADLEVQRYNPNAWALLLDSDGFVAEGTGSNFFLVKDKIVYTPEGRNCLRGISRKHVMELCYLKVIDFIEKNLTLYDVYDADEAFFTNTPYCIVPIRSVNGKPLNLGTMTEFLMETWEKEVKCPWREQARKWDSAG